MTYRGINREVLRLALPSIMANITIPLVGIVDLAITGHLGDASLISGIVIGTMLFDLLYWNMSFLRMSTGGFTAQAYGAGDMKEAIGRLWQGLVTAVGVGLLVLSMQWIVVKAAFALMDLSAQVQAYSSQYFFIRVWAVPAALMLMVLRGWFIGMQNTLATMVIDVYVNVGNALLSFVLAVTCGMGIAGVALGTVIAQWTGLLLAGVILLVKYRGMLRLASLRQVMRWSEIRSFFSVSGNHFVRSCCMQIIYLGFTAIATRYGDVQIAVSNIMMKVLLLFSYFLDGFSYAAQAMVGRFVGARRSDLVLKTVRIVFLWSGIIGIVSTLVYGFFDESMFLIFTTDTTVLEGARAFMFWLLIMPLVSSVAFTWDGIYTGALATGQMMWTMIVSASGFLVSYRVLEGQFGIQALYIAYFVHLLVRSLAQSGLYFFSPRWRGIRHSEVA